MDGGAVLAVMNGLACFALPLVLLALGACAPSYDEVTGAVETSTFSSTIVGDQFLIQVRLPVDYDASRASGYPTVFQLDGTNFGPEWKVTAGHASTLEAEGQIPSTIVIGIGYPYEDPLISRTKGRFRDYVTRYEDGTPGGADRFLQFVHEELIPQLETTYRIDSTRRVLSGHSLGGFVALYELFTTGSQSAPPFAGFIAGDPSLTQDDFRLFTEAAAVAARSPALSASVWFEIARFDGAVQTLAYELLRKQLAADLPSLRVGGRVANTDHPGTISPGFRNGLIHVLGGAQ